MQIVAHLLLELQMQREASLVKYQLGIHWGFCAIAFLKDHTINSQRLCSHFSYFVAELFYCHFTVVPLILKILIIFLDSHTLSIRTSNRGPAIEK